MTQPPSPDLLDPRSLPTPATSEVVQALRLLSHRHDLLFRLETGRTILEYFYRGDAAAFRSFSGVKETPFAQFVETGADALRDLDLGERSLRRCVHAYLVVRELSEEAVQGLVFMHLVELARIGDLDTRRALATLAVQQGWTASQLRLAAQQVKDGRWPDALPEEPGIFPEPDPEDADEGPSMQPGRVVTRFAKVAKSLDEVVAQWESLDLGRVKPAYRERVAASLERLVARVAEVQRRMAGGGGE